MNVDHTNDIMTAFKAVWQGEDVESNLNRDIEIISDFFKECKKNN